MVSCRWMVGNYLCAGGLMLDNQLISQILSLLATGFTTLNTNFIGTQGGNIITTEGGLEITTQGQGLPNGSIILAFKQAFQPIQQGVNTAPTVYMFKLGDELVGAPYRAHLWNPNTNTIVYTETQKYMTSFQISCLATQDPSNVNSYTASDIANFARYVLQCLGTITALEAQGIGILRVGQVRNPTFIDDRERWEYSPNFDIVLTHDQVITLTQPIINETVIQIEDV